MPRCFVIQPFDKGEFDKRYDDVFVPAIKAADFEPYRVDRDYSADILIETIEKKIRDADACLADISLENPNVWYEVGFAIASGKDVVLVCKEGSKFPFDVRHRAIVVYATHSTRDFEKLKGDISERLKALDKKNKTIESISSVKPTHGLTNPEMVALALIMENQLTPNSGVYPSSLADDMEKAGFTRFAAALALSGLLKKRMTEVVAETDFNGNEFEIYRINQNGIDWCEANQGLFVLQEEPRNRGYGHGGRRGSTLKMIEQNPPAGDDSGDDIPF